MSGLSRRPGEKALRVGVIALLYGIWGVLGPLATVLAIVLAPAIPRSDVPLVLPSTLGGLAATTVLVSSLLLLRVRRLDVGARGRARFYVGATVSLIAAFAQIGFVALLAIALADPGYVALGAPLHVVGLEEALGAMISAVENVAYAQGTYTPTVLLATLVLVLWPVQIGIAVGGWFLIDSRVREWIWRVFDAHVLAAFIFALWALPFSPPEEDGDPTLPAMALGIATLFAIRSFARMLPSILDAVERTRFEALVAARMLRARKSGFLTAIGLLSILAVSFSSCTLTTVLSVMGGFRVDLRRKILGHRAHVVVDREYGTWEGWGPVLERVRAVPGVRGASPYISGEVMVTSASNLGRAAIQGIDPRTIADVTELPRILRHGRLEYLAEPERLLHLSPDEMSGSLLDDRRTPDSDLDGTDLAPAPGGSDAGLPPDPAALLGRPLHDEPLDPRGQSLMREIDRVLGQLEPLPGERRAGEVVPPQDVFGPLPDLRGEDDEGLILTSPPPLEQPRDVLPGLIVGTELARSLRLHVGDEVNVVSPLGELGPSGPMPRSRPFRIAGIFYSGMYEYDMGVVYTDLETAQRFLSAGGAISGIQVQVEDWERAERSAQAIRGAIARSDLRVRSWQETNRNLFGALELEKLAMFITLGIAILVASFCIIGTLVLMVQEKGREVGILKAMGAHDRQIVLVFMLQGLFIGLLGAATGLGLGWLVCFTVEHYGHISLNSEVYYIDRLPVHVEASEFVAVGVAGVIVCLLATIYPAILGSRLRPVDALRYA